jgi:hypothetical protein
MPFTIKVSRWLAQTKRCWLKSSPQQLLSYFYPSREWLSEIYFFWLKLEKIINFFLSLWKDNELNRTTGRIEMTRRHSRDMSINVWRRKVSEVNSHKLLWITWWWEWTHNLMMLVHSSWLCMKIYISIILFSPLNQIARNAYEFTSTVWYRASLHNCGHWCRVRSFSKVCIRTILII